MSIQRWIADLVLNGRLFPLEPAFRGEPVLRHLYMSAEVRALVDGPWPSGMAGKRCAELRAELEAFVSGREIGICLVPFEAGDAQMGLLDPASDGIWDFRSRHPKPGIRILGCFAAQNDFVALVPASRSVVTDFIRLGPLGDRSSVEWKSTIRDASMLWTSLFQIYPPVSGGDPGAYFSSKYTII